MGNALGVYESRYVVKKAKSYFYCMLQSWPNYSDPTVGPCPLWAAPGHLDTVVPCCVELLCLGTSQIPKIGPIKGAAVGLSCLNYFCWCSPLEELPGFNCRLYEPCSLDSSILVHISSLCEDVAKMELGFYNFEELSLPQP